MLVPRRPRSRAAGPGRARRGPPRPAARTGRPRSPPGSAGRPAGRRPPRDRPPRADPRAGRARRGRRGARSPQRGSRSVARSACPSSSRSRAVAAIAAERREPAGRGAVELAHDPLGRERRRLVEVSVGLAPPTDGDEHPGMLEHVLRAERPADPERLRPLVPADRDLDRTLDVARSHGSRPPDGRTRGRAPRRHRASPRSRSLRADARWHEPVPRHRGVHPPA